MRLLVSHILSKTLLLLLMALFPFGVYAQGFMVEPMRMDISVTAGQVAQVPLNIRNTSGEGSRVMQISLVELDQHSNGGWKFRYPAEDSQDGQHQSSLPWTTVSNPNVEIAPLEPAELMVRVEPPRGALGAYFAALLVETAPIESDTNGIAIKTRFLIPIIIDISGRSVRQNVQLNDLVMTYDEADGRSPTTNAHFSITNAGETFSNVTGDMRIERWSGENWRLVTRFQTRERPIIPGVTLELGQDLERRLPSGEYRLRADVTVDGRRLPPLQKEITFEGDPNVDALAYDTELRLTPGMVQMDVVPGATRTTILRIENPGENAVNVDLGAATPRGLVGVRMGDLVGAELSAERWTTVRPSQFTLRGGASQNVRVVSAVPAEEDLHANYYADLTLAGTYADGQSAGQQSSVIHLVNKATLSAPRGIIETVGLAETEPNQFVVQAKFINTGNTHVTPLARVVIATPQGQSIRSTSLTGDNGMLLPLGQRVFGGEIDFTGVEPGTYGLRASVDLDDGESVTLQRVIEVEHEDIKSDDGVLVVARVTMLEGATLPNGEDTIDATD
jgi:hypothetical protein